MASASVDDIGLHVTDGDYVRGKKVFRHNTDLPKFGGSAGEQRLIIPDTDPVFGLMNHGCEDIHQDTSYVPMQKRTAKVFRHNTDIPQNRRQIASVSAAKKPQATRRSVSRQGSRMAQDFKPNNHRKPAEKDANLDRFISEHKATSEGLKCAISEALDDLKLHKQQTATHVRTAAYDKALSKLQDLNYIVLTGSTGVGKTYTALSVLDHMVANNPDMNPVIIHSATEFNKLVDVTENLVVLVDDFGGDVTDDDVDISTWHQNTSMIRNYLKEKKLYLILTAHKDTIRNLKSSSTELKSIMCSEALIDFDDQDNGLTENEKTELCMKYAKSKTIPLDIKFVTFLDTTNGVLGFPLLCKLMPRNNFSKVFENPIDTIEDQVDTVAKQAKSHFIVLLLTFLFDGQLPQDSLSESEDNCYDQVLSFVKIRKNYSKILDTAEGLVGTVLKNNKVKQCFTFIHPELFQVIMRWLWKNQKGKFMDLSPLKYFSCLKTETRNDLIEMVPYDKVILDQSDFDVVLDRLRHEVGTRKIDVMQRVAASKLWECSDFIQMTLQHLGFDFFFVRDQLNVCLFSYLAQYDKRIAILKLMNYLKSSEELKISHYDIQKSMELACLYCRFDVFKFLMEQCDNVSDNVILATAEGGDIEIMKLIATKVHELNVSKQDNLTAIHIACLHGHKELVKYLYSHMTDSLLLKDSKGRSILHQAIISGSKGVLKFLLSNSEIIDSDMLLRTSSGATMLHTACERGWLSIVKYLSKLYPSMKLSVDQDGLLPADYAVAKGHVDCLQFLLNSNSDTESGFRNGKIINGRTRLHIACLSGKPRMVKYLCKTFPDMIKSENYESLLPVHDAIMGENIDVIDHFMTDLHCQTIVTSDSRSLLHVAAFEGKLHTVKHICSKYPTLLKICDSDGNTAAHDASASGNVDVLKCLLERGIDPRSRNYDGCSMLHDAAYFGRLEMVKYLCEKYPDMVLVCSNTGYSTAHAAALGGSVDLLKYLISTNGEQNVVSEDGSSLLHEAAYSGQLTMVQFLCSAYPDMINSRTKNSFTPCHYSVQEGHEEVTFYLLGKIADTKILTDDNETFLHIAAYNGRLGIVKYLSEEFSDLITMADATGATVLHAAARGGHMETMLYLLDMALDPAALTENGSTLLHLAAYDGRLEMVKFLCDKFPDMISFTDSTGHSPGHYAAGSGNTEVFKYLLSKGIDPLAQTENGSSCLLKAAYTGKLEMVEYLVQSFPELLQLDDQYGCTAAHYSACEGHIDVLKFLLSKGISPSSCTVDGHTILHIAAFHGRLDVVAFLCKDYPELLQFEDKAGQTVWTFAESGGHRDILEYLRRLKRKKHKPPKVYGSSNTDERQTCTKHFHDCWIAMCNRMQTLLCCCRKSE